jgi:anaphase-promoting complex subunit 1
VKLDFGTTNVNALSEAQTLNWPSFHNGVAAGLRLAKGSYGEWQVTRNWIFFNCPTETPLGPEEVRTPASILEMELKKASHGGLLFALGMHGHLNCLFKPDLYRYFWD